MIRALAALAKGEVGAALTLHPLSLPFVGLAVLAWFAWGIRAARGEGRPLPLRWWLWGGGAGYGLLAAVWIVRFARGTLPP